MAIQRVLIANRGEIAVRIIRACRALGIETVQVVSDADRDSLAARLADRTLCIGPAESAKSYLQIETLLMAASVTGCDAVHPGYGFLSESADFARRCAEEKLTFVGPTPDNITRMGNKIEARRVALAAGVPVLPGSEKVASANEALAKAREIGAPVMLKAAAGGGGRGMKIVHDLGKLAETFQAASAEAKAAFGDGSMYVERYVAKARHVEVQILADSHGTVLHLGERDCSSQRRHQKMVEEAPAPQLSDTLRQGLQQAAVALARAIDYVGAGTVEFLVDAEREGFYFLEVNTRIQVEHPVTEMITGIDLVQEQFRVANGERLSFSQQDIRFTGHAIEARVNAESPAQGFRPTPGRITGWTPPEGPGIRVDSHCYEGYRVPIFYDSMIAKLIVHGRDRAEALAMMEGALAGFEIGGIETTIPFVQRIVTDAAFARGDVSTVLVDRLMAS
ncbi:acetyl-CoA carboxylase biotin carboxylase subunit [Pararhodobacter aggregans]|uniref:Biotin carboxylase n=1 Tax=Pararhodobacter aggregans TaxID=404875 RepID=A0A2T7UVG0_9RHOB|nr:acetyl-CoA carboxylase biotin carboxylase subunit [Pararhodobacter aggregans]PTX03967.1 acetyl-CoA carboxylase biotin carboxylase subunit [Pararhodobacter aggregans]PVE48559.1 acetyl-CoA carboxylase biotin carboxylase subunit [Pararhodobacter aggregans]